MSRTQVSRTSLSRQACVLRASLLWSLGLAPLACGGTAVTASNGDGGGGSAQAGAPGQGGAGELGGAPAQAGAGDLGGASSRAGAPAAGAGPVPGCSNPVLNQATKLVECANGLKHRAQALACTFTVPPPSAGGAAGAGAGGASAAGDDGAGDTPITCFRDADCAGLPNGYCDGDGGFSLTVCHSGCTTDSDCGAGVCACNGTNPGRCTSAGCQADADCGPGGFCAPTPSICGPNTFQCMKLEDECSTTAKCGAADSCVLENGRHVCKSGAMCGRPFLIAESARMASIEARTDWLDPTLAPDPSGLTAVERAELAAHWARLGQMEHASIAAFARFNLQLLSLGAPSDLVEACNRALADETAHARACFALASAYGGIPLGPARLDLERCFEDTSLEAIAKLVLREGCLGETVASLEALAAAEVASEPAVKQALTRIGQDELNHAELAFKFLRWALTQMPAEARYELAREAAQQLADFENKARHGERTRTDDRLAAHGLIAGDALRAIHLAAVRDVARPLLAALFELETSNDA